MSIDLLKDVTDRNKNRYVIEVVMVRPFGGGDQLAIDFDKFVDAYSEYVDPKDLEIARLNKIIEELKSGKQNGKRKNRVMLTDEQWKEVEELIRKGVRNIDIASEYKISDSAISKRRIAMRAKGENV